MRLRAKSLKLYPPSRIIVTAVLLLALLSVSTPTGAFSPAHLCTMACCASLLPHEAGSCHAHLSMPERASEASESHCDGHDAASSVHGSMHMAHAAEKAEEPPRELHAEEVTPTTEQSSSNPSQGMNRVEASVYTKPCSSECGAGVYGPTNQNRGRDSILISHAERPRPPSVVQHPDVEYNLTKMLNALCRKCAPRAPPVFFS